MRLSKYDYVYIALSPHKIQKNIESNIYKKPSFHSNIDSFFRIEIPVNEPQHRQMNAINTLSSSITD